VRHCHDDDDRFHDDRCRRDGVRNLAIAAVGRQFESDVSSVGQPSRQLVHLDDVSVRGDHCRCRGDDEDALPTMLGLDPGQLGV